MSQSAPEYLAELYRLEELEGWQLLARHLELTEGFSFVVVLAPDDAAVAYLRSRLPDLVGTPEAVRRVVFDPAAGAGGLAESLLDMSSLPETIRIIWIDADAVDPEQIPARDAAWREALARLNRYRNTLQERFRCTLVMAGPFGLQKFLREAAPDLWSIRSLVCRIEAVGSARMIGEGIFSLSRDREDMGLPGDPGDPAETLAEAEKIRGKPGREILLAQLLHRTGRQAYRRLQWDLALKCLREAFDLEEAHGGDPELRFELANDIALLFHDLAKWDRAFHYCRRALEIAENHFGQSHPMTATALNNLAALLQATNRLSEAEPLIRRALAIDEARLGKDHPSVASMLSNLAQLLKATNRLADAEPLMRQALSIDEASFGKEHPRLAIHLNNLAKLLRATNRSSEAEALLRRALAIDEGTFGKEHPKVAIELNNLAELLRATNRLVEAEPLIRRALAIDEASFGNEHPRVATDLNNLAAFLRAANRLTEAERLIRRALAIDEASFGKEHPRVAIELNNLAELLRATNRPAEAEPLMRRALAIDEASFGNEHPTVAVDLNNLAQLLQDSNRLAEAEALLRRAVEILDVFGKQTGYEHPGMQKAAANYRRLLEALGKQPGGSGPDVV